MTKMKIEDCYYNPLWRTIVGSHMWGMNRPNSDVDLFIAYLAPSSEILMGTANTRSRCGRELVSGSDAAIHEIGTIIEMVLKGNVNFLWGVFSPLVMRDELGVLESFREIALESISKRCAKSIYGMSKHNYERYMRDNMGGGKVEGELLTKKANTIVRTLKFGINLLDRRGPVFEKAANQTMDDVLAYMELLKEAEKYSELPDTPPNENEMRGWLLELRMREFE